MRSLWVCALMLGALGCDNDESFATTAEVAAAVNDAVPKCTPGRAVDCPCPGGASGVQICGDDGKRWGACGECAPVTGSGSSSSSSGSGGGSALDVRQIDCDSMKLEARAAYPGKKAAELSFVRVLSHHPPANPPAEFTLNQVSAQIKDGEIRYPCNGGEDYVIFVMP